MTDKEFLANPEKWPHGKGLVIQGQSVRAISVKRRPILSLKDTGLVCSIWPTTVLPYVMGEFEPIKFDTLDDLLAAGWVVD